MSLLSVDTVSKSFGGVVAVRDVSFSVGEGEIFGLMGANGAGKTTLFSLIAGHNKPNAGEIRLDGARIDGLKPDRICRAGIARTFQIVRPFRGLTALENVATAAWFGADPAPSERAARERAAAILDELGLGSLAGSPAASLTLAAQKKLEVAKALATAPRVLLLDEVMAGLTPTEVRAMMADIVDIRRRHGLTVLIVEHVMSALMELSERIFVLHHGEKIAEGTPAEIGDDPAVQAAYLGSVPTAGPGAGPDNGSETAPGTGP